MKIRLPLLLLSALATFTWPALGIIVIDPDEIPYLAAPPNGAPWNYVARLDDHFGARASAVYLGNHLLLTANHVDTDMNNIFLNGINYAVDTTFTPVTFPSTDLRVMRMVEDPGLPPLPLIAPTDSAFNQPCTMIGFGVGKGTVVPNQGWNWADDTTRLERWATNTTLGAYYTEPVSNFVDLETTFDSTAGPSTGQLTSGDSGGGLFINFGGTWKLVGINSDVDTYGQALYNELLTLPAQPDHSYFQSVTAYTSQLAALVGSAGPVASTLTASNVLPTGATLNGSVNPSGVATTVHFDYGPTTAYGTSSANTNIGAGSSPVAVRAVLANLPHGTTYHYRVVAASSQGTTGGTDFTFSTPKRQATDFTGNGTPDLVLFAPATRATEVQTYNKNMLLNTPAGPTLTAGYQLAGVADFNQDGQPDYLLVNPSTGALAVWLLNGTTFSAGVFIHDTTGAAVALPAGWQVVAVADMNGDGQPDLVLFNPANRNVAVWYLTNSATRAQVTFTSSAPVTQSGPSAVVPAGWQIAGAADFNADGQPDLLLFNPATLQTAVWFLNAVDVSSQGTGPTLQTGWQLIGTADFNSDGQPDLLIQETSTRTNAAWFLNGLTLVGGLYLDSAANTRTVLPAGFNIAAP